MADINDTFELRLISPDKILFSDQVNHATMPGEQGRFGVLKDHCQLIASLIPGTIEVEKTFGAPMQRFFITGGFTEIKDNKCIILVEQSENYSDLSSDKISKRMDDLKDHLDAASGETETKRFEGLLEIEQKKLSDFLYFSNALN